MRAEQVRHEPRGRRWTAGAATAVPILLLAELPLGLWLLLSGTPSVGVVLWPLVAGVAGGVIAMVLAAHGVRRRMLDPLLELRRLLEVRASPEQIRHRFTAAEETRVGGLAGHLADVLDDLEHRRASGSRLSLVASCTSNAVAITDAAGRIEWCNPAFQRWFGDEEAVTGRPVTDVVPVREHQGAEGDDAAGARAVQDALRTGEGRRGAFLTSARDDASMWVEVDVQPVFADDGLQAFVMLLSDISRQHQLQEHVESSRRRLEAILDAVPAIVMYRDPDGTLVHCNASAADLLGRDDARSLAGCPYAELAPDHAELVARADRAVIEGGEPLLGAFETFESERLGHRILRTDRVRLEDPQGGRDGVLAVATDVTAQRSLESRLDFAMRTGRLGVWEWEPIRGTMGLSRQLLELLGHAAGDVDATFDGLVDLIHPGDREAAIEAIDAGVCHGDDRFQREIRVRRGDGSWTWMLLAGRVQARVVGGRAERVLGVLIDIESQKRDQSRLAEAVVEAEAAGQARTAFLASMSHELRTPLTAILGYAELLQDPTSPTEDRRYHAETIMRNGRHLVTMIDDLLDLSRIEAGRLVADVKSASLGSIVRDVRDTLELSAREKNLEISIVLDGPVPVRVRTDPGRLRQILLNVVGNAVKFTDRGSVRMSIAAPSGEAGRRRLRFQVTDTGPGIADQVQARLFQPFERADDAMNRLHGGTGLGLAISRRLAELLEGTITVRSVVGEGSTFTIDVAAEVGAETDAGGAGAPAAPHAGHRAAEVTETASTLAELVRHRLAADDPATTGRDASGAASAAGDDDHSPLEGRRILLVEDGPDNQRLISHHLRRAGALVDIAEHGGEALARLREVAASGEPGFDLVVMDMQMPVMDGYAATRELRLEGFDVPVIALTAHAMSGDRERCLQAGCTDYATKPIDRRSLVARCAALSNEARRARRSSAARKAA